MGAIASWLVSGTRLGPGGFASASRDRSRDSRPRLASPRGAIAYTCAPRVYKGSVLL